MSLRGLVAGKRRLRTFRLFVSYVILASQTREIAEQAAERYAGSHRPLAATLGRQSQIFRSDLEQSVCSLLFRSLLPGFWEIL
jgi:hypothetical protein